MNEPTTIAGLVAERAVHAPAATALAAPGREPLTYSGLHDHIQQTSRRLAALGIGAGERVAVLHRNGPELCSLFLGVAATAACAPLNPAYREPEFEFYLSDLDARALLIEAGLDSPAREVALRRGIPVLDVQPVAGGQAGLFTVTGPADPRGELPPAPSAADVALVLHTSGTTARPKLVPLTHANLCASAGNVARSLSLTSEDRCLNVMPLFHIHGLVAGVLASLRAGSCVICTPGFDPGRFLGWLEELDPTWYTAVPTMHQAVVASANGAADVARSGRLRLVRSSSAPLAPQLLAQVEETFACPAIEAYGMTEAAHQITSNPLPPEQRKAGSVGRPLGVEVAILDESGRELPPGAVGEVALRGPNVFAGYGDNPEANETAFTGGWFRTGDQGSFDEDGYLFLRGRLKEIINRAGEKVSPREVDEVLLEHPAVAQVVTFARPHESLGEDVAVAVVLEAGASASQRSIQEFAAARLADFKIPRTVVFLDELPKGPTGKIQRVGLADRLGLGLERADGGGRPEYVAPRTGLEQKLAAQWEDLLGVERVGAEDDFFDLGGDSIAAATLFAWIEEEALCLSPLPVSTLLWAPTLERLATAIEESREHVKSGSLVVVDPEGAKPPFFFAHGHDGSILMFLALAKRLRSRHPFYAIEPRADGWETGAPVSVEELARQYADEIRSVQPAGPYYLGGHCLGGAIALEIARNLAADGERIGLLALLDPIGEPDVGLLRHYWRRYKFYRERGRVLHALSRLPTYRRRRRRRWEETLREETPLTRELRRARQQYVARPFAGEITLLRGGYYLTPASFWETQAGGGLRLHPPISGDVSRSPGIDEVADQLSKALEESS